MYHMEGHHGLEWHLLMVPTMPMMRMRQEKLHPSPPCQRICLCEYLKLFWSSGVARATGFPQGTPVAKMINYTSIDPDSLAESHDLLTCDWLEQECTQPAQPVSRLARHFLKVQSCNSLHPITKDHLGSARQYPTKRRLYPTWLFKHYYYRLYCVRVELKHAAVCPHAAHKLSNRAIIGQHVLLQLHGPKNETQNLAGQQLSEEVTGPLWWPKNGPSVGAKTLSEYFMFERVLV